MAGSDDKIPTVEKPKAQPSIGEFMEAQLRLILGATMRGVAASYSKAPAEVMLPLIARVTGTLLVRMMGGDANARKHIRKLIIREFIHSAKSVEIKDEPMPMQVPAVKQSLHADAMGGTSGSPVRPVTH